MSILGRKTTCGNTIEDLIINEDGVVIIILSDDDGGLDYNFIWEVTLEKKEEEAEEGGYVISMDGTTTWFNAAGEIHREGGPAITYHSGHKEWLLNGRCHREDGPAIEYSNGCREWRLNGETMSKEEFENKFKTPVASEPESEFTVDDDGIKAWRNAAGELHRKDGPAIEHANGSKIWYSNGLHHRLDGPATENASGYRAWWVSGKRHREDGPAVEYCDGDKSWWLHGEKMTEDEFKQKTSSMGIGLSS